MYNHAVIVLGCGIDAVGNLNDDAKGSVQLGIDAYRQSDKACIIMSGHVSYKADFTPSISEAQAMKDYAISLGVPVDKVFVEAESKDSLGNLLFTKQNLLLPLHINTVTIIRGPNQSTDRIQYLATKVFGSDCTFTITEPDIQRPEEQPREQRSLAKVKQWLDTVDDGDAEKIYALMRERHPGYNSTLSRDIIKGLL